MPSRSLLLGAAAVLLAFALTAAPASAAALGMHPVTASFLGGIFGGIGSALLGAFNWTVGLASKFLLVTLGSFVRMLIPRSWASDAIAVFEWIVAIPNYAGTITTPAGAHQYGFAGVNALRDLFQWTGIALLPLTLTLATGRAAVGHGSPIAAPISRVIGLGLLLASYTWWWSQGAALVDQLTHLILSFGPVVGGIHQLMAYATEGVALGGWQLIDLGLMGGLALELLALIALKVVIILAGAILYATGPLMIGLVATETGLALARAWLSAVGALLTIPVLWATICAVGAVLIGDASTAGPLITGNSGVGQLLGGVIVAIAGAATLWLCLRAAREAAAILRVQVGGQLMAARGLHTQSSRPAAPTAGRSAAQSVRAFQSQVRDASSAALTAAGPAGARTLTAASGAARVGRRGLLLSGAEASGGLARAAGHTIASRRSPAPGDPAAGGRTVGRAGAVASRMARAGAASWQHTAPAPAAAAAPHRARDRSRPTASAAAPDPAVTGAGARRSTTDSSHPTRPATDHRPSPAGSSASASAPSSAGRNETSPAAQADRPTGARRSPASGDRAHPDATPGQSGVEDDARRRDSPGPAPRSSGRQARTGRRTAATPPRPSAPPAGGGPRPDPQTTQPPTERPGPKER